MIFSKGVLLGLFQSQIVMLFLTADFFSCHHQFQNTQKEWLFVYNVAHIYLFKVNNGNSRTVCEIYLKLIIKAPDLRQNQGFSGVFRVLCKMMSFWCRYCQLGTGFSYWSCVFFNNSEQVIVLIDHLVYKKSNDVKLAIDLPNLLLFV